MKISLPLFVLAMVASARAASACEDEVPRKECQSNGDCCSRLCLNRGGYDKEGALCAVINWGGDSAMPWAVDCTFEEEEFELVERRNVSASRCGPECRGRARCTHFAWDGEDACRLMGDARGEGADARALENRVGSVCGYIPKKGKGFMGEFECSELGIWACFGEGLLAEIRRIQTNWVEFF